MEPHERLSEALDRRRRELGMTWRAIATAADISYEALRAIRRGDYRASDITAAAIDRAVRWEDGSVEAIYDGGDPTPLAEEKSRRSAGRKGRPELPRSEDEALAVFEARLEELVEAKLGRALSTRERRVVIRWAETMDETLEAMEG
ncbi:helix-turn-helix domain-containing protein [Actinomadura opuntiae]|uniref:helix-turn-helix domain-containing protein n=1 Tax=Actinomadura sp. OS1-43 TaxID=604315 RepID=UPI00255B0477|nr:helix-turn-helix transcriptional regulator [Actinomadura sp. OS1-43]MDL4812723.1 helix-turn-helix transcriptional regulator [Actinomadura sp. OS1-43]